MAAEFVRIARDGFSGATFAMVNYLETMLCFIAEVLPRLVRLGIRKAMPRWGSSPGRPE